MIAPQLAVWWQRLVQFDRLAIERGWGAGARTLNALAHQAEAVGVHTAAGQAEHDVPGLNVPAGQDLRLLDHADRKAGQVVLAGRVHAGHLGGFTANQGAARQFATAGNAAEFFSQRLFSAAQKDPKAAWLAEALHYLVKITRYGCDFPDKGKISKKAFNLLHKNFADSDWAKKTPHWFN